MFSLKQIFKKDPYSERIGNVLFSKEILPYFHETPPITNKTLHVIQKNIDDKMVMVYELGMFKDKDVVLFLAQRVLTQDNIPIKTKDINLKYVQCNEQFTKDNYQKGQIYLFNNMGYLDNLSSDKIIEIVTDQLVIFREVGSNILSFYTYEELRALKDYGKIKIAC